MAYKKQCGTSKGIPCAFKKKSKKSVKTYAETLKWLFLSNKLMKCKVYQKYYLKKIVDIDKQDVKKPRTPNSTDFSFFNNECHFPSW